MPTPEPAELTLWDPPPREIVKAARACVSEAPANGTWRPHELDQQVLLAHLDRLPDDLRARALRALGLPERCTDLDCRSVLRIRQAPQVVDLAAVCWGHGDVGKLVGGLEHKPRGAPPHVSFAPLDVWRRAKQIGAMELARGEPKPEETCNRGTCEYCKHLRYGRDGDHISPVFPQVVVAVATLLVGVTVLTDQPGTLEQVWGVSGRIKFGPQIERRDILDAIRDLASILDSPSECVEHREMISWALAGLFARTNLAFREATFGVVAKHLPRQIREACRKSLPSEAA